MAETPPELPHRERGDEAGLSFHIGDEEREPPCLVPGHIDYQEGTIELPEFDLDIQVSEVRARPRQLRAQWSAESLIAFEEAFTTPPERWRLSRERNRRAHLRLECPDCVGSGTNGVIALSLSEIIDAEQNGEEVAEIPAPCWRCEGRGVLSPPAHREPWQASAA